MKLEDGFVTLLEVNLNEMPLGETTSPFITVVELEGGGGEHHIGQLTPTSQEEVVMYRLPGEKLGMGLKFEGGMHAAEYVSNVYIQSVAVGSPASRTPTVWGGLVEGDEIVVIDGRKVCEMTRVDCVTTLKKAPVAIKLIILHRNVIEMNSSSSSSVVPLVVLKNGTNKLPDVPPLPPPVPPRKLRVRKDSSCSDTTSSTDIGGEHLGSRVLVTNRVTNCNKISDVLGMKLPGWEELMLKRSLDNDGLPCPAGLSVDLIGDEDRRSLFNEYESDDTGSSASTVIERLSNVVHLHSTATSVKVPSLKKLPDASTINISQVLSPFEQLEVEIESDVLLNTSSAFESVHLENFEHGVVCEQLSDKELPECLSWLAKNDSNIIKVDEEMCHSDKSVVTDVELPFCCMQTDTSVTDNDIEPLPRQKTTPPPVPPRKMRNGRRNSLQLCDLDDQMSCLNFPIIGNLLQELEQLPEFPHPNIRIGGVCSEFRKEASLSSEELLSPLDGSCEQLTDIVQKQCQNSEDISEEEVCDKLLVTTSDSLDTTLCADPSFESSSEVSFLLPSNGAAELVLSSDVEVCAAVALENNNNNNNNTTCEVVAVIEKPLHPACEEYVLDELTSNGTTEMTAANNFSSDNYMEFADDDDAVPSFSRLPPDGHEFPSCYKEPDVCMTTTYSECSEKEPHLFDSQLIQPPVGFEDNEAFSSSNRITKNEKPSTRVNLNGGVAVEPLDDSSTISSQSSEAGETVIFDEFLPPPPSMSGYMSDSSNSEHSKLSMKTFEESPCETPNCQLVNRIAPLPSKRRLPPKPNTSERSRAKSEETLSVKDKIALFTSKAAPPTVHPKPRTVRSVPTAEVRSSVVRNGIQSNDSIPEVRESVPYVPIRPEIGYTKDASDLSNGVANKNDGHCYDRPTSSLSMSSWISKSSDDLLSQDFDSSDVDERGFSSTEKRLAKLPSNVSNRYSLDYNSQNGHWSTSSTDSDVADSRQKLNSATNRSMYSILESHKQNVTKLKGLVIPERKELNVAVSTPDLPLIFSVDSILLPKVELQYHTDTQTPKDAAVICSNDNLALLSKSSPMLNAISDVPKYSPAFKRKGFSVYEGNSATNMTTEDRSKPDTSLDEGSSKPTNMNVPPLPKSSPPDLIKGVVESMRSSSSEQLLEVETDCSATLDAYHYGDTEDQESGISSIESPNVSIHNTPPGSPRELHLARLSFSANSNCDTNCEDQSVIFPIRKLSLPSKRDMNISTSEDPLEIRVLKANSVEAINRMNVLQSSRSSCGGVTADEVDGVNDETSKSLTLPSSQKSAVDVDAALGYSKLKSHRRQVSLDEMISFSKTEMIRMEDTSSSLEKSDTLNCERDESSQEVESVSSNNRRNNCKPPTPPRLVAPKTVSDERWQELAKKYGKTSDDGGGGGNNSTTLSLDVSSRHVFNEWRLNSASGTVGDSGKSDSKLYKSVADQWKCRSSDTDTSTKLVANGVLKSSPKKLTTQPVRNGFETKSDEIVDCGKENYPEDNKEESRSSVIELSLRPKKCIATSRPSSLIETDTAKLKLWEVAFGNGNKMGHSGDKSRGYSETPLRASAKPNNVSIQDVLNAKSRRSTSFNDLRQIFENQEMSLPSRKQLVVGDRTGHGDMSHHMRMSSLDSTASDSDMGTPVHYGSATSLGSSAIDHYGSITSLASSTSLISPQELQQLIDEANQSLEESGTPSHEINVIVIQREIPGGSIGITLAGGADYDCKEITVNKVISGSLADRDGRIQKGDRVMSINGKNLKGVSHREALNILKTPRTDCVLVLSRSKSAVSQEDKEPGSNLNRIGNSHSRSHQQNKSLLTGNRGSNAPVKTCAKNVQQTSSSKEVSQMTVEIVKDGSGLGFSLDGGKDSPHGDKPLTIKKIFTGSAADKHSQLNIGDEVVTINGTDVTKMARIEAWNFMRKLPDGLVFIVVNHQN